MDLGSHLLFPSVVLDLAISWENAVTSVAAAGALLAIVMMVLLPSIQGEGARLLLWARACGPPGPTRPTVTVALNTAASVIPVPIQRPFTTAYVFLLQVPNSRTISRLRLISHPL